MAFHPIGLFIIFAPCFGVLLRGLISQLEPSGPGSLSIWIPSILFRAGMVLQWATFLWERRKQSTPKLRGNVMIQLVATAALVAICGALETRSGRWEMSQSPQLVTLSVSPPLGLGEVSLTSQFIWLIYSLHDICVGIGSLYSMLKVKWLYRTRLTGPGEELRSMNGQQVGS